MIIEFETIKEYDYDKRVKYWPIDIIEKKNKYFGKRIFSNDHPNNYWLLSEQYYTIAWTLYTASFKERANWSFSGELESYEMDESHKKILAKKVLNNNWSDTVFLSFAHLSCELAFKAIIFHKSKELDKMFFPKGHDLEKLLEQFENNTKRIFIEQFKYSYPKLNLEEILFESGNRFVEQRYGEIKYENDSNEIICLCKFIHENLKLEKN